MTTATLAAKFPVIHCDRPSPRLDIHPINDGFIAAGDHQSSVSLSPPSLSLCMSLLFSSLLPIQHIARRAVSDYFMNLLYSTVYFVPVFAASASFILMLNLFRDALTAVQVDISALPLEAALPDSRSRLSSQGRLRACILGTKGECL